MSSPSRWTVGDIPDLRDHTIVVTGANSGIGFETVFGTNHLGHFAFTCRVLPALLAAPGSRVVTVSSMSHRLGRIRWDDIDSERRYSKARAYAQSKLANLLFAFELQRHLADAGAGTISLAAHPGFASTEIIGGRLARFPRFERWSRTQAERHLSAGSGARPSLRAATDPEARGGQFYGPSGLGGISGTPVATSPARRALDEREQARLWELSEELTSVRYP